MKPDKVVLRISIFYFILYLTWSIKVRTFYFRDASFKVERALQKILGTISTRAVSSQSTICMYLCPFYAFDQLLMWYFIHFVPPLIQKFSIWTRTVNLFIKVAEFYHPAIYQQSYECRKLMLGKWFICSRYENIKVLQTMHDIRCMCYCFMISV